MSFVISFVLACTAILATFMLELCDDGLGRASTVIGALSFFGVLAALYFVDYKKKFALSQFWTNTLVILAVAVQLGALARSRQDLLAFMIANILATVQTILFFRTKTLRKCYQTVSIAFIEVAVGCVFQRTSLFVTLLPVFAVLAFASLSLLYLWGERKYYAERVELKARFSGNKNLRLITAEESLHAAEYKPLDSFDSADARLFGTTASSAQDARFFRRPSIFPIFFSAEYFSKFLFGSLSAFLVACLFFCLFPRVDEFGFGPIKFNEISWGRTVGGGVVRTGFRSSIELGDLGPALDSKESVMTAQFVLCKQRQGAPVLLDANYPVYFRGIPLSNYKDRTWTELSANARVYDFELLKFLIGRQSLADPDFVLNWLKSQRWKVRQPERIRPERMYPRIPSPAVVMQPQFSGRYSSSGNGGYSGSSRGSQEEPFDPVREEMERVPVFGYLANFLPERREFHNFNDLPNFSQFVDLVDSGRINTDSMSCDLRNDLVAFGIELKPLDTRTVFAPSPVFVGKTQPDLLLSGNHSLQSFDNVGRGPSMGEFWFLTTGFRNGRQALLVPNQEAVWGYLNQYLEIDQELFPELIRIAKEWDEESNLPKENFIARARYLESKLRDSGEYRYNRTGVLRDPDKDPLEDFISLHKEGHCEYFAGALAMVLRAVGIPSRVVVGYSCYISPDEERTTVRQSDAHSWVEAYIPPDKLPKSGDVGGELFAGASETATGESAMPQDRDWTEDGGWLRLDATPSADRDADRPNALALGIFAWSNFFRSFGNDFVLNFNAARQMRSIYEPIARFVKGTIAKIRELGQGLGFVRSFVDKCRETFRQLLLGDWSPNVIMTSFVIISAFVVAIYLIVRLCRYVVNRVKKSLQLADEEERRRLSRLAAGVAGKFYDRLEQTWESRLATTRRASETPREFFARCFRLEDEKAAEQAQIPVETAQTQNAAQEPPFVPTSGENRALLSEFVERYYLSKFGGTDLSPAETDRWTRVLTGAGVVLA